MPFELAEPVRPLGDETPIPVKWLFGLFSVAGGVVMVGAGLLIWGTRLEAKGEFRESRITKVEQDTASIAQNQSAMLLQLVEIKVELQHLRKEK